MNSVLALPFVFIPSLFAQTPPTETDNQEVAWTVDAAYGPTHTATISTDEGTWVSVSIHEDTVVFDLLGDLWSVPVTGGDAVQLTQGSAWDSEPRFSPDGEQIAYVSDGGGNEQIWIMNADGTDAKQFTDEDTARITDPVWDPNGRWLLGRKRTVDTRSIGVTELWQYHLDGGSGFALTSKDNHPHAGEMATNGNQIWFSSRQGRFDYDANPLTGLWRVMRLDRETGDLRQEVGGNGSAIRPTLTPDGTGMVFVSRDRHKTILEHLDFKTRKRRVIADWLDHDQMEGFALHGVYPSMDWTSDGDLVLWAKGKLWRLNLDGTRVEIPFRVQGEWVFHDVPRWPNTPPDIVESKLNRWTTRNIFGDLAYSSMGRLVVQKSSGEIADLGTGYAPAWTSDGTRLAWTSWSDKDATGRVHITSKRGSGRTQTLDISGQLLNPAWSKDAKTLVLLRDPNSDNSPNLGSIPWYELIILHYKKGAWKRYYTDAYVDTGIGFRAPRLHVHNNRIWWLAIGDREDRSPAKSDWVSCDLRGKDFQYHMTFPGAVEAVPSPDFTRIAYKLGHQAWITALPHPGTQVDLDGLPKFQLTDVVGDWLGWSANGQAVSWTEGNTFVEYSLDGVNIPKTESEETESSSVTPVGQKANRTETTLNHAKPRARPESLLALVGATVLTMDGDSVVDNATIVINGDRIEKVAFNEAPPEGAKVINLKGKTVIPGLIDVHAHLHYGSADVLPEQPWQYNVNLDFGVTTVQDPSASTDVVFTQAERVESGLSKGPRVYSTGYVLYGALGNENAETPDKEAAYHHVERLKMVGANSVKVYQQSRRDQRQWYVEACNANQILCIAEGGGDLWMNLSMAADGFHAIEHALPTSPLYDDIHQFLASSPTQNSAGTAYSPTLLVAYGGLSGELYFYRYGNAFDNRRLLRHWDRRDLDSRTYRGGTTTQPEDWNHQHVARDANDLAKKGVLVTLGAHGQLQGLGVHWELWALGGPDAMTPMEALRAGTINGAIYLGMDHILGSISAGKLADLVVLNADPREDISATTDIHMVFKNGELVSD